MDASEGIDLSPLHRELDRLKTRLCRCNHTGECMACKGFEVLRQQSQMVVAAASQPVLMQLAQEAAMQDMLGQLSGAGEKLTGDPRLQELIGRFMELVQEDLGGPEELKKMFGSFGGVQGFPGFPGFPGAPGGGAGKDVAGSPEDRPGGGPTPPDGKPSRRDIPWDDLPPEERNRRS